MTSNPGFSDLRVLFVQDHAARPGEGAHGVTSYLSTTLPALKRLGVDPKLCVLTGSPDQDIRHLLEATEPAFFRRHKWDPRSFWDIQGQIREFRPDIMHLSAFKSVVLGRLLARLNKLPSIVHIHDAHKLPAPLRLLSRIQAKQTRAVIAVSKAIAAFASEHYGFRDDQIRVFFNGIDIDRFGRNRAERRDRMRAELGIGEESVAVGVVGRLAPGKGQDVALEAMRTALGRCSRLRLFIIGGGPLRPHLEALAAELEIQNQVTFLGHRPDIADIYAGLDMTIVPSVLVEGMGLVAIEAMASGVPVIAHKIGGLPEIIEDGVNGHLVETGNGEQLSSRVVELATDQERRSRMAHEASLRTAKFSVENHAQSLLNLYSEILDGTGAERQ